MIALHLIQKFTLKITKFFVSIEIATDEVLLVTLEVTYNLSSFLPNEIENTTFDILMPHTKPITIGVIYRPPNQSKFLDIFEVNLPKLNTSYREIYFLGDFIINLFENGKYIFDKSSSNNKNLDSFTKSTVKTALFSV